MRIVGLVFAGTSTKRRPEMVRFVRETLGLEQVRIGGVEADMFELPDGARFAVGDPLGMGDTSRSVGFLVEDLENAVSELRAAGVEVGDEPGENDLQRYIHFRAPDGQLYELIEEPGSTPRSR
jgi:catechol 2,3-dioxygenase-like lactoylglutathione lyase family enzyme